MLCCIVILTEDKTTDELVNSRILSCNTGHYHFNCILVVLRPVILLLDSLNGPVTSVVASTEIQETDGTLGKFELSLLLSPPFNSIQI